MWGASKHLSKLSSAVLENEKVSFVYQEGPLRELTRRGKKHG